MEYRRLCEGLADKGTLIPANDNIFKYIKNPKKDYYISVYKYNEKHKEYFNKAGTIAGITDVVTDKLIFDFDDENNVENALSDTKKMLNILLKEGFKENNLAIYYSGKKGFHIELKLNENLSPKEAKNIALNFTKGLETFDSSVYNAARIIRIPQTKHQNTNLFKTRLNVEELNNLSIDDIKDIAKEEYELDPSILEIESSTIPSKFKVVKKEKPKTKKVVDMNIDLDYKNKPKYLSPWKYALSKGYFPIGQRSNALDILARTFKAQNFSKEQTYYLLKAAADLQSQRFDSDKFEKKEIWNNIINQVYSSHNMGGTYAEDNFPEELKKYLEELGVPRIDEDEENKEETYSVKDAFANFEKYANDIDINTLKFGIPDLDNILKVQAGHLVGILAPPKTGKTTMAIELLNNTSKQGIDSFFASYDMASSILLQKLVQREMRMTDDEVFDAFRRKDMELIEKFKNTLNKNYANVSFNFKVGQSINALKRSIEKEEEKGKNIKLVVVDYLELILTDKSDSTSASAEAIQGLREIANAGRVVIILLQPNKVSSKANEPLLNYTSAKGSSAIGQAVTSMITCHRPGFNDRKNDNYFSINIVANRMGVSGDQIDFKWDGATSRITPLEDIEKQELKELREIQKLQKENDDLF